MTQTLEEAWTALTDQSLVWWSSQDAPSLLYRHARWHFISLGWVKNVQDKLVRRICGINFMSTARARESIHEGLPYYQPTAFDKVAPWFEQEVQTKLLPTGEDYQPWLRSDGMKIIGGLTTDTLETLTYAPEQEAQLMGLIQGLMQHGTVGPWLAFEYTGEWLLRRMKK